MESHTPRQTISISSRRENYSGGKLEALQIKNGLVIFTGTLSLSLLLFLEPSSIGTSGYKSHKLQMVLVHKFQLPRAAPGIWQCQRLKRTSTYTVASLKSLGVPVLPKHITGPSRCRL